MASAYAFSPLKLSASVSLNAPASVPLRTSAALPIKATVGPVTEKKVHGHKCLTNFTSNYVFIRHGNPDDLKSYDRLDFGLFGRSWLANASWSIVFAPGATEDNWHELLPPPGVDFMDDGDLLHVIASGSSNGLLFSIDKAGFHQRAVHDIRTVISLNELKRDASVWFGGSLFLHIGLLEIMDNGEVRADTDLTIDGQVYWNLYSK